MGVHDARATFHFQESAVIEAALFVIALGVFLLLLIGVSRDGRNERASRGLLAYREERRDPKDRKAGSGKGGRHA